MIRLETERFYKEDGCFGRIRVKWINDHILLMNDNDEATGYLVLGAEKAVVIDTMNGYENVKQVAEHFTSTLWQSTVQIPVLSRQLHRWVCGCRRLRR